MDNHTDGSGSLFGKAHILDERREFDDASSLGSCWALEDLLGLSNLLESDGLLARAERAGLVRRQPVSALLAAVLVPRALVFVADRAGDRVAQLSVTVSDASTLPQVVAPFFVSLPDLVSALVARRSVIGIDITSQTDLADVERIRSLNASPGFGTLTFNLRSLVAIMAQIVFAVSGTTTVVDAQIVVTDVRKTIVAVVVALTRLVIQGGEVLALLTIDRVSVSALLDLDMQLAVLVGAPVLLELEALVSAGGAVNLGRHG